MDNGTDEVYVEDGPEVDEVEEYGKGKEAPTSKACHDGCVATRRSD